MLSPSVTTPSTDISPILMAKSPTSGELEQKVLRNKISAFSMDSTRSRFGSTTPLLSPKDSVDIINVSSIRESAYLVAKVPFPAVKIDPRQGDQENVAEIFTEPNLVRREKKSSSILKKSTLTPQSSEVIWDRADSKGIPIVRGGKKHSVTFQAKIHRVTYIENWKAFNKEVKNAYCQCRQF